MRRFGIVLLPILAGLIVAGSAAASRLGPNVTLRGSAPLIVHGAHFRGGERVKLTSSTGASVTVRANSGGAFTVRLGRAPVSRCSPLIVLARGFAGSLAVAHRLPQRQCLPMRSVGSLA